MKGKGEEDNDDYGDCVEVEVDIKDNSIILLVEASCGAEVTK